MGWQHTAATLFLQATQSQLTATTTTTAIIHVNLRQPAPPVKNWRILLVQSFTARMSLLTATSAFGLGRRRCSSQQCYLHCLCAVSWHYSIIYLIIYPAMQWCVPFDWLHDVT